MAAPDRFSILASLAPQGGFRRVLALERGGAPRAVVLAFAPPEVVADAARLAAVLRDAEAATRLHHPGAAAVLGTETVGGELAVVELHRPGATLRGLLDRAGRLPADVAVRILLDVCAGVGRALEIDAGEGRRLAHGAIDPARIVVGEDGAAFVVGFGLAGGGEAAADVQALGAVLFESLAGEPPGGPARPLDVLGVPAPLAAAVDRATGAAPEPFASPAALAGAIAAALPPAGHAAVGAYADAILPQDEGERAELRRTLATALGGGEAEEVAVDLIVDPTQPGLAAPHVVTAGRGSPPRSSDAAGTFARPAPPRRTSRLPAAVAALCIAAGFAIGFELSRGSQRIRPSIPSPTPTTSPGATPAPAASAEPPAPTPSAPPRKPARAERPARSVAVAKGKLDVNAPPDAEVLLDGRRIGRGNVQIDVAEGAHRIEVRRAGATVAEHFTLRRGETWTYTVTPTP